MKTTSAAVTFTGMYDVVAGFGVPHITAIDRVIEALLAPNARRGWGLVPSRHGRRHAGGAGSVPGIAVTASTPEQRRPSCDDLRPTGRPHS